MKNYIGDFDAQMFIENLIRNKETCSSFYFDFDVDEDGNLSKLFWADPISIKNCLLFGEMASVDSTLDMYATLSDRKTLTTELWKEVYSCVSVVEDNEEDMKYLIEKLRDLQVEVKQKQCNIRTKKDKKKEMEKFVGCPIPDKIHVLPPKHSKTKGSGKRIKSSVLKALKDQTKQVRYCKTCGKRGHNSRTCKYIARRRGMPLLNVPAGFVKCPYCVAEMFLMFC